MMNYSIIQKSQIEGAHRIDAEYFQPKYLAVNKVLLKLKTKKLSELSESIRSGPFGSNMLCETYVSDGIPIIRPFNLANLNTNSGELVSISREDCVKQHLHVYGNNDVFISRVGEVKCGIANGFDGEITISPNIVAVRTNRKVLDPYFLTIFLNSRYGCLQVERGLKIVAQPTIETNDVKNLTIPIFETEKQESVANFLKESLQKQALAKFIYSQAENLLLEELGLKDFKPEEDLTYTVNLSEAKSVHRVDPDYFQPKYERLLLKIRSNEIKLLGDLVSIKKGIEPGSDAYQENGNTFIRVSSLSKHGFVNKDQKYLSDELYQKLKNNFEPKIGEILLTKDATPGIAYVLKESVKSIIAGGIVRLKLKGNVNAEYITLCINSIIGQMQAERDAGGSIIVHWKPEQIKNLRIPILSQSTQQKIADLVRQSHEARRKARELLEEAKQKVERMIEEG